MKPEKLRKTVAYHSGPLTDDQYEFASKHVGLVFDALKNLRGYNMNPDDKLSTCGIALIYAVRTFDSKKGMFSPHYYRWARSLLIDEKRKLMIRYPKRYTGHRVDRVGIMDSVDNKPNSSYMDTVDNKPDSSYTVFHYHDILTATQEKVMHKLIDLGETVAVVARDLKMSRDGVCAVRSEAVRRIALLGMQLDQDDLNPQNNL